MRGHYFLPGVLVVLVVLLCPAVVAAAANPFSDVPADSWAYKAVVQLAKDGIIDGYPDGTFKGDRSMSRYEMAQIVYNAIQREDKANAEQRALIDKLSAEFVNEINNLGVKVTKLEEQVNNRIYLTGLADLRYNNYQIRVQGSDEAQSFNGQKLFRTSLYVNGAINDSWKYFASLRNDKLFGAVANTQNSSTGSGGNNYTKFRQAYVKGNLLGAVVSVGRQENMPAYGFVADEDMTGLKIAGGGDVLTWQGFWGTTEAFYPVGTNLEDISFPQAPVTFVDFGVSAKLSDTLNVKAAYLNPLTSSGSSFPGFIVKVPNVSSPVYVDSMVFYELGFDWAFANDWLLTGVCSKSNAQTQNLGYRAQVDYKDADINTPGSWHAWLAYTDAQAFSTWDSTYNDLPGYNANTGDTITSFGGAVGWEIGLDYVWDKNILMELMYNSYNPTASKVGQYQVFDTFSRHFEADFLFYF
ncbi:MAG: S-layer homology domain-containing protein [Negativicutes bacterium]|nr:S-layer homology domain-containing protein [Negativicutes bacterium]